MNKAEKSLDAFLSAASSGNLSKVKTLFPVVDSKFFRGTALNFAIVNGQYEVASYLLKQHVTDRGNVSLLNRVIKENKLEAVKLLVESGADIWKVNIPAKVGPKIKIYLATKLLSSKED